MREVYVRDPDFKKLLEGGFVRVATPSFEGIGQIQRLGTAMSAEDAARPIQSWSRQRSQPKISWSARTQLLIFLIAN
jgi:hypothetical protein